MSGRTLGGPALALFGAFAALPLPVAPVVSVVHAADRSHCDPSLAPSSNYPYKYAERGDRCEGVYVRLVGSSALTLLSFTSAFEAFDPKSGQPLVLEWVSPPKGAEVRLRAVTTRPHLYYRMDTSVRAGESRYAWPTDVLAAMGLGRADVGLVGSTRDVLGDTEQEILLPLTASPKPPASIVGARPFTLLAQSSAQLSELFVTVSSLTADGGGERTVQPARELGYGYYPADDAIEIPIEAPAARGVYAVQLGAKLRGGGVATLRFLFYTPGHG